MTQDETITMLQRKGFRIVNRLSFGDVVMVKRSGPMREQAQVDEDGDVNGMRVDVYLRSIHASDGIRVAGELMAVAKDLTAGAGMPQAAFQAKVRRIMQKIAARYGGTAKGQVASGKTENGASWSATISRHNASNGETFGRLEITVGGRTFSDFWSWDRLFEKAGIPVSNAVVRLSYSRYPIEYFMFLPAKSRAESFGLIDVENGDLTGLGLVEKMKEWQMAEHGVDAYVYDDAVKRLRRERLRMPSGIRRVQDRAARIAGSVLADMGSIGAAF